MKCLTCKFFVPDQKTYVADGRIFRIPELFNCSMEFVVNYLTCPCGLFYVESTIRALCSGHGEHYKLNEQGTCVPRNFVEEHKRSTNGPWVWLLEVIPKHLPLTKCFKKLCKRETFWTYKPDTL